MNIEDWLVDHFCKLEESRFYGRWVIEFKDGKITLVRFEKTEFPPKELYSE